MPDRARTPVIVGVAQASWRGGAAPDPIAMCAQVVQTAARDSGAGERLLERSEALGVVDIASRRWSDPAALVAALLGIAPAQRLRTQLGGDGPLLLLGRLGRQIAAGELDAGIVCGAEALATLAAASRRGEEPGWPALDTGAEPTQLLGIDRAPANDAETQANLIAPVVVYPLIESLLWEQAGGSIEQHRARLGELWERYSRVAATNPVAWSPEPRSAEQIATPAANNRLVTLPYTKLLNSNIQTDQAAALIVCSAQLADELGVPPDRRVHLHGLAHAHEHWLVSERDRLDRSPALAACGAAALADARAGIDDVALLDLYSCFPSAVQIAGRELGLDPLTDARAPTVTGGLTFAGGPGNNYVTHALAASVELLRADPGELGLVTAVGWYLTKHAVCVLGAAPPAGGFRDRDVQASVDALPRRAIAPATAAGAAAGEAATVVYDREGQAVVASLTALLADGARAVAKSSDPQLLAELELAPPAGRPVVLDGAGGVELG